MRVDWFQSFPSFGRQRCYFQPFLLGLSCMIEASLAYLPRASEPLLQKRSQVKLLNLYILIWWFSSWDSINPWVHDNSSDQTLRNSAGITWVWPRLNCIAFRQGEESTETQIVSRRHVTWPNLGQAAKMCKVCEVELSNHAIPNFIPNNPVSIRSPSNLRPSLSSRLDTNCPVISLNMPNFGKQVLSSGIQLDLATMQ